MHHLRVGEDEPKSPLSLRRLESRTELPLRHSSRRKAVLLSQEDVAGSSFSLTNIDELLNSREDFARMPLGLKKGILATVGKMNLKERLRLLEAVLRQEYRAKCSYIKSIAKELFREVTGQGDGLLDVEVPDYELMEYCRLQAGEFIYRKREQAQYFYLLLRGRVVLEESALLGVEIGEGELFGMSEILTQERRKWDAHCLTEAALVRISRASYQSIIDQRIVLELDQRYACLAREHLFDHLSKKAFINLFGKPHWKRLSYRQVLFRQGDRSDFAYLAMSGEVKLVSKGHSPTIKVAPFCLGSEAFAKRPRSVTAIVHSENCLFDVINPESLEKRGLTYKLEEELQEVVRKALDLHSRTLRSSRDQEVPLENTVAENILLLHEVKDDPYFQRLSTAYQTEKNPAKVHQPTRFSLQSPLFECRQKPVTQRASKTKAFLRYKRGREEKAGRTTGRECHGRSLLSLSKGQEEVLRRIFCGKRRSKSLRVEDLLRGGVAFD